MKKQRVLRSMKRVLASNLAQFILVLLVPVFLYSQSRRPVTASLTFIGRSRSILNGSTYSAQVGSRVAPIFTRLEFRYVEIEPGKSFLKQILREIAALRSKPGGLVAVDGLGPLAVSWGLRWGLVIHRVLGGRSVMLWLHEGPTLVQERARQYFSIRIVLKNAGIVALNGPLAEEYVAIGYRVIGVIPELRQRVRRSLVPDQLNNVPKFFLTLGSRQFRKGVDRALQLAGLLRAVAPEVGWFWFGASFEGPEAPSRPVGNLFFLPPLEPREVEYWLNSCTAVVLLSREDPDPLVLAQSKSIGKPVIVSEEIRSENSFGPNCIRINPEEFGEEDLVRLLEELLAIEAKGPIETPAIFRYSWFKNWEELALRQQSIGSTEQVSGLPNTG